MICVEWLVSNGLCRIRAAGDEVRTLVNSKIEPLFIKIQTPGYWQEKSHQKARYKEILQLALLF